MSSSVIDVVDVADGVDVVDVADVDVADVDVAGVDMADGLGAVEYTSNYGVVGMSCGHCVAAVTEGLEAVPGVTGVEIDLPGKRATVRSVDALDVAAVRDAIEGAGYQLA